MFLFFHFFIYNLLNLVKCFPAVCYSGNHIPCSCIILAEYIRKTFSGIDINYIYGFFIYDEKYAVIMENRNETYFSCFINFFYIICLANIARRNKFRKQLCIQIYGRFSYVEYISFKYVWTSYRSNREIGEFSG